MQVKLAKRLVSSGLENVLVQLIVAHTLLLAIRKMKTWPRGLIYLVGTPHEAMVIYNWYNSIQL